MKYLFLNILLFFGIFTFAQNAPIDFETNGYGTNWVWTTFENSTNPPLQVVANPDTTGINPSSRVAKFTALQAGQPFAGCETLHGGGIGSFTIDNTNAIIRIMVYKPVISDVGVKLVRFDNWSLGEIKIPNTQINQWEILTFDFSSHIGNTYDQIVIFPDFSSRSQDNVIYFDNIYDGFSPITTTNIINEPSLLVFPNPASDQLMIQSEVLVSYASIFNMQGQLLQQCVAPFQNQIDISELPNGVYWVQLNTSSKSVTKKFIKSE